MSPPSNTSMGERKKSIPMAKIKLPIKIATAFEETGIDNLNSENRHVRVYATIFLYNLSVELELAFV